MIVIASYRQTVRAYSTSGGSYVVSKENLGRIPSLVAAAALLVDYVLTVAVSVAAGILAITSAVPSLSSWIVELSIAAVVLITVVNLRGVRESGVAFAIPTYAFILAYLAMMGAGVGKCALATCPVATTPDAIPAGAGAVTFFVLLRAFASGSAALTGIEAISNGVSAFRHPQARNAARTLAILGVIAVTFFIGVSWLAVQTDARAQHEQCPSSRRSRGRRSRAARRSGSCSGSSRSRRSRSSSSPRTPRSRASRGSRRCSPATASSRASSRTWATGSSSRTGSSSSPGSRSSSSGTTTRASTR